MIIIIIIIIIMMVILFMDMDPTLTCVSHSYGPCLGIISVTFQ